MTVEFNEVVTAEAQFRAVTGNPAERVVKKHLQLPALDRHCRAFIGKCPFLLISSRDAAGNMDISPKGDPPGFVRMLDDKTLAIPDRPGNRRADTFRNILENPRVGLLFLIPGKQETLRMCGTATIVRDRWVREPMAVAGKLPEFAIVVHVNEVFFHCAKCVIRSRLWDTASWPDIADLAHHAQLLVEHGKLDMSVEQVRAKIQQNERERLY
ncbi:MAG TPA: MSMEG_1061 family FMN-dependent PPOX-type flavoprotein [Burkholderiales bacterium]|nr:MSMEG_1061 family FMN-dependent PPOX-type flavoprotein [Burkholderiales bacterium]